RATRARVGAQDEARTPRRRAAEHERLRAAGRDDAASVEAPVEHVERRPPAVRSWRDVRVLALADDVGDVDLVVDMMRTRARAVVERAKVCAVERLGRSAADDVLREGHAVDLRPEAL